mgnify:CR=1 FL=1
MSTKQIQAEPDSNSLLESSPRPKPSRFQKGQSGNPGGRPGKEVSITSRVIAKLKKDPSLIDQIANTWLKQCKGGRVESRRDLIDRLEGKVPEAMRLVLGDKPLEIKFIIQLQSDSPATLPPGTGLNLIAESGTKLVTSSTLPKNYSATENK